jgi:hypothetical protein
MSSEIEEHEQTKRNERPQHNSIPPLLRPNPPNQPIDPRNLAHHPNDPPIDARQHLPLHPKTLIDRVRLTQHAIRHIMAVIDASPLVEHVFCFGCGGIAGAVGVDVGADGGEEVRAGAGVGDGGFEAVELAAVVEEDLAVAGEVVLF